MALSARSDIILVGASAGGLNVLKTITSSLPGDLQAAVIIVVHMSPNQESDLAGILDRCSDLSIRQAADGEPVRYGTALIAPPNQHLVFEDGVVRVVSGPKMNAYRPSIDVTFKSAARRFGARAIGVVLTGGLKDGTDGLRAIKESGGRAVVQDPEDAAFSGMPRSAIENVEVDRVLRADGIAAALVEMASDVHETSGPRQLTPFAEGGGLLSEFICPECKSTLLETRQDGWSTFRCRNGHMYTEESLAIDKDASLQAALWSAARALHEQAQLFDRLVEMSHSMTDILTKRFKRKAALIREQGRRIENAITRLEQARVGEELDRFHRPEEPSAG